MNSEYIFEKLGKPCGTVLDEFHKAILMYLSIDSVKDKLKIYLNDNLEVREKSYGLFKSKLMTPMEDYCASEPSINNYINETRKKISNTKKGL